MRRVLPPEVSVVDTRQDVTEDPWPEEAAVVARAVESRRREYVTTRHCARRALAGLGIPPVPLGRGPRREPLWPAGVVGSLTHCAGYRAAAVARAVDVVALGIDAEPHAPLPEGVADLLFDATERRHLVDLTCRSPLAWDRIAFSAKESVYKAWFPLTGQDLGFEDARVTLRLDGGLTADLRDGQRLSGRWSVGEGLVRTAVVIASQRR